MKIKHLWMVLMFLAALVLAGCSAKETAPLTIPEGAQTGDSIGLEKCNFRPGGSETQYAAECGTLVVQENRDKADSRLISLPVVRIPASGPDPAQPVFFLQGGPGGSNLSWEPPNWILENHDVVMVGYRGVDGTVELSCREVNSLIQAHMGKDLLSAQARAEYAVAVKQCAVAYTEAGVDLSGYTVPSVVEDLEAARTALGYDRINLFSESYGTRVAQIYAYMYPDSLHRLILIGVNTPGHFIWDRSVFDKMIGHISELCAKDAACSSRTSDFAQTMYAVNHNMPKRWLENNIDPDTVRYGTHVLLFSIRTMPMVFDAYLAAAEGDLSGLATMNRMATQKHLDLILGDEFSKGGNMDLDRYRGVESVSLGNSIMGAPLSEFFWPMVTDWPVELAPKDLREFQESNVEMLLVNGTVDFSTPPIALEEAKPYYHNAQMVLLAEFSHVEDVVNLQPKAFERLITSYYDTGVADDSSFMYQPVSFKP